MSKRIENEEKKYLFLRRMRRFKNRRVVLKKKVNTPFNKQTYGRIYRLCQYCDLCFKNFSKQLKKLSNS